MTKGQKCQCIVETIIKLTEAGVDVSFSQHMGETLVETEDSHWHLNYLSGDKGKVDSMLSILANIEEYKLNQGNK